MVKRKSNDKRLFSDECDSLTKCAHWEEKMGFLELHIQHSHSEPSFKLIHVPGDFLLSHRKTNLSKQWSSKSLWWFLRKKEKNTVHE